LQRLVECCQGEGLSRKRSSGGLAESPAKFHRLALITVTHKADMDRAFQQQPSGVSGSGIVWLTICNQRHRSWGDLADFVKCLS
jgi:hypothetical protein